MDKYEYDTIQSAIQINEKTAKKTLQQRKFKKYNYLKHNPKPAVKATDFQKDSEKSLLVSH